MSTSYATKNVTRRAVLRLHLPDGTVLRRQVVEECDGKYLCHYPLTEETPQTSWLRGDYHLKEHEISDDC